MMAANGMERISTPGRLWWHRFRYTTLPLIGLGTFVVFAYLLWKGQGEMPHAIGEIEVVRVDVASPLSGILKLPKEGWTLYETVKGPSPDGKGTVLAQLDDKPLQAQRDTLVQELARLQKELDAVKAKLTISEADRRLTYMAEAVRLHVEWEQRSLVALERQAEVAVNQIEAQRRTVYYECLKPLYDKKIVSELELNNARYLRDEAMKRLAENTRVAQEAETQQKIAKTRLDEAETPKKSAETPLNQKNGDEKRWDQLPRFLPADIAAELAPITAAIQVQKAKIEELNVQIGLLTIHAPFDGMISAIYHWPESAIRAGDPIVTVASDKRRYLVCYVLQEQHVNPTPGMAVDVRKRAAISPTVRTVVEQVGPQIEQIPVHLARDPKYPEWGVPVRITLPENFAGRPGELFEVTFKTGS